MIRRALEADLPQLVALQPQWSIATFKAELALQWSCIEVAELEQQIAGFVAYWSVAQQIEIHNIVTREDLRRRGIARALLTHVLQRPVERVSLEVRAANTAARQLYASLGFAAVGLRRKYYACPVDDAVILEKILPKRR